MLIPNFLLHVVFVESLSSANIFLWPNIRRLTTFKPIHFLWAVEKQAIYLVSSYTQGKERHTVPSKKFQLHFQCVPVSTEIQLFP